MAQSGGRTAKKTNRAFEILPQGSLNCNKEHRRVSARKK